VLHMQETREKTQDSSSCLGVFIVSDLGYSILNSHLDIGSPHLATSNHFVKFPSIGTMVLEWVYYQDTSKMGLIVTSNTETSHLRLH
jgi:hypothetical protein